MKLKRKLFSVFGCLLVLWTLSTPIFASENGVNEYYEEVYQDGILYQISIDLNETKIVAKDGVNSTFILDHSTTEAENLETRLSDFENMNIYCSYNNLANSLDYPASYNQVIGVGKINNSNKTTIKRAYSTNKILVINNFESKYFEGDSFLSLLTAIEEL